MREFRLFLVVRTWTELRCFKRPMTRTFYRDLAQLDFASVSSHFETKVLFPEMTTMTAKKPAHKPRFSPTTKFMRIHLNRELAPRKIVLKYSGAIYMFARRSVLARNGKLFYGISVSGFVNVSSFFLFSPFPIPFFPQPDSIFFFQQI